MGTSVLRTGAVGSGQAMKALNNLVSTGGFLIGIEALLIGQRFGLDPAVMTDVLNAATGMNNSTQKKFKQFVLSRKFDAGFTMGLLAKDLSIALQVGRETDTPAPLSALVKELIVSAQAKFGSNADHTEMAKPVRTARRLGTRHRERLMRCVWLVVLLAGLGPAADEPPIRRRCGRSSTGNACRMSRRATIHRPAPRWTWRAASTTVLPC